jgi:hypothetical protein
MPKKIKKNSKAEEACPCDETKKRSYQVGQIVDSFVDDVSTLEGKLEHLQNINELADQLQDALYEYERDYENK